MSLFFGNTKGNGEAKPAQRRSTRANDSRLDRQQRKSRKKGARKAFDAQRRADILEMQRRILTGELVVPEAVRRNVENHYARLMEQQERKAFEVKVLDEVRAVVGDA